MGLRGPRGWIVTLRLELRREAARDDSGAAGRGRGERGAARKRSEDGAALPGLDDGT